MLSSRIPSRTTASSTVNKGGNRYRVGAFMVALATFLCVFPTLRLPGVYVTLSDGLFVVGTILIGGVRIRSGARSQLVRGPAVWLFGCTLLFLGLSLSSILNGDATRALVVIAQYAFAYLLVPAIFVSLTKSESMLVSHWFIVGVGAVTLAGIILHYFFPILGAQYMVGGRMSSFMENPNALSKVIALALPIWLYCWSTQAKHRALYALLVPVFITGLLLAGSFGGLIASALSLSLFLLLAGNTRLMSRTIGMGLVVVVAALLTGIEPPPIFERRIAPALQSGSIDEAGSFDLKMELSRGAWRRIQESPILGVGADQYQELTSEGSTVHNTYLLLWVEGGILSVLGWCAMLTALVAAGLSSWRSKRARIQSAVVLSVALTFIFSCFSNTHVYARYWGIPVFISLLILINSRSTCDRESLYSSN